MRRAFWGLLIGLAAAVLAYDLSLSAGWWKMRQTHARRSAAIAASRCLGVPIPRDSPAFSPP